MNAPLPMFGAGLLALGIHAALVVAALNLRFPKSPMAAHVASGVAGAVVMVILATWFDGRGAEMWRSMALFVFGWALLLFVYSAVYKSVSLRLLLAAPRDEMPASYAELADRILRKGLDERIESLVGQGFTERSGSEYRLTRAGAKTVAIINSLRDLFAARTSGMYGFGASRRRSN